MHSKIRKTAPELQTWLDFCSGDGSLGALCTHAWAGCDTDLGVLRHQVLEVSSGPSISVIHYHGSTCPLPPVLAGRAG